MASLGVALVLGTHTDAPAAPSAKPAPRPNVIVIQTDDQTQASMSVMPMTRALIGGQGVTFANSFANWPVCCPSRATLLTGQYAHNHGVLGNNPPKGGFDRLNSNNTLPLWLQGVGYYTGQIGKYLNGYGAHRNDPGGPLIPPGWSEFHGITDPGFYGFELNEGGILNTYGSATENPDNPADPGSYSTDVYTAKTVDFINRRAAAPQPYFLYLNYNAPHAGPPDPPGSRCFETSKPAARHLTAFDSVPVPRPPSFDEADLSDKPPSFRRAPFTAQELADISRRYRCRLASMLAVDEGVEQIYAALAASGELSNTLLVFTSDNGYIHGEHRIDNGKLVPYEESIRVPLLIRGPGFRGGKTTRELAVNADLAATIVRAAGAQPGLALDGIGLQGAARSPGRERGRELSIETNSYTGVRTSRYTYLEYKRGPNNGFAELYDLRSDPFQLQNLSGSPAHAAVRTALAARLASLRGCAGNSCRYVPRVWMKLRKSSGPRRCARRPVRARVKGRDVGNVVLAEFFVDGRRAGGDRKRPFERTLPYRKLKIKKASVTRVRATLLDGRRVTIDRRVRACR